MDNGVHWVDLPGLNISQNLEMIKQNTTQTQEQMRLIDPNSFQDFFSFNDDNIFPPQNFELGEIIGKLGCSKLLYMHILCNVMNL